MKCECDFGDCETAWQWWDPVEMGTRTQVCQGQEMIILERMLIHNLKARWTDYSFEEETSAWMPPARQDIQTPVTWELNQEKICVKSSAKEKKIMLFCIAESRAIRLSVVLRFWEDQRSAIYKCFRDEYQRTPMKKHTTLSLHIESKRHEDALRVRQLVLEPDYRGKLCVQMILLMVLLSGTL
jgi:DNA-dependent RNA polymerase auxiliary subunit epsilon